MNNHLFNNPHGSLLKAGLLLLMLTMPLAAMPQGWQWIRSAGGSGTTAGGFGADERGIEIIDDPYGNTYIAGYCWPGAMFDTVLIPGIGEADIFLASYDSIGNLRWVHTMGGTKEDNMTNSTGIHLELINNQLFIAANMRSALTTGTLFRIGDSTFSVPASTTLFAFMGCFTTDGTFKRAFFSNQRSLFHAMSSNQADRLYLLYWQNNPGGNLALPDSGLFYLMFDTTATLLYHTKIGPNTNRPVKLRFHENNLYFTGLFRVSSLLFNDTLISLATSATADNAYLAAMDTNGIKQWVERVGSTTNISRIALSVKGNGKYLTGSLASFLFYKSTTIQTTGHTQSFVLQFDSIGNSTNILFSQSNFPVNIEDNEYSINDLYITGAAISQVQFNSLFISLGSNGFNGFITNLTNALSPLNGVSLNGSGQSVIPRGVSASRVVTGSFDASLFTHDDTVHSAGGNSDIFIAKYNPHLIVQSIEEQRGSLAREASLYPNPAGSFTGITLERGKGGPAIFQLYDLYGKLLYRTTVAQAVEQLRFPALQPGLYLWEVQQGKHRQRGKLTITG